MSGSAGGRVPGRRFAVFGWWGCAGFLLIALGMWLFGGGPSHATAQRLLAESQKALRQRNLEQAEILASRIPRRDECWAPGQVVAGEAAMRRGDADRAMQYFRGVAHDGTPTALLAAFSLAELLRDGGRLSEAEREYRYVLELQPQNSSAHTRLAFVLGATGRRWESLPNFMYLLRHDAASIEELILLGDLERPMEQGEFLRRCAAHAPGDLIVQLGLAANAADEGHADESRRVLQAVVDRAPHLVAAQAMLGELLVDDDDVEFLKWHAALPAAAAEYTDIWFVRGLWARRQGNLRVAARCFWETVRLAPPHRRGIYQLGQVLVALGEGSGSDFADRAAALFELGQKLVEVLRSKGQHEPPIQRVAELMEKTGRYWEACGWAARAGQMFPDSAWPIPMFDRLSAQLTRDTPQTVASANLALKYDLSGFPDHEELLRPSDGGKSRRSAEPFRSAIRFEEAAGAGIDFTYVNGREPSIQGARMFEQTGGGVAVIDFDGDGWPDLYFTQGGEWKPGATAPSISGEMTDRLYRNLGGQHFVDVTHQACLVDRDFGQGCAVGDFDNDGFPDLYVANIGCNRLQHNNGDGTFSDVTGTCGIRGETWTASCLMVDLNADGFPDLFDVTYLTGDGVYEITCQGHGCSPKGFDGLPDRLFVSLGDGTFAFIADSISADTDSSKGLGVVAVALDDRRRPCLFISNDQVPNFLLRNSPAEERGNIRLADAGFASGLAFNGDGLAMASMGIAADDANGDGRIDFFVTNFKDESKVLYLQDATGMFVDATSTAGLRGPGWELVGWGTQFLDADRDGEPDLVVVNGHIDDYRDTGGEWHMRPQFFRNTGKGRFVELKGDECGAWFGRKYLGRGLARLDWNRDGRMDFVVSNIGDRASLVSNVSRNAGHYLNVRLHARHTARDAIGSVVEVAAGGRRWVKQLVAGDGYMASNERLLQFGIGDADAVRELLVRWPSGATTTIPNPPVDVTVELVEGTAHVVLWRGSNPLALEFPLECLTRAE